jgi:hypothetical protein
MWPDHRTVESQDRTHSFEFDYAFGEDISQLDVYQLSGQRLVDDILEGYNATILAYGQTGSGKTFCMFGPGTGRYAGCPPVQESGIVQCAVKQVFDRVHASAGATEFVLRGSLFEIYREQLRDLLDPSSNSLKIKETLEQGIYVDGLRQELVTCESDVAKFLRVHTSSSA